MTKKPSNKPLRMDKISLMRTKKVINKNSMTKEKNSKESVTQSSKKVWVKEDQLEEMMRMNSLTIACDQFKYIYSLNTH